MGEIHQFYEFLVRIRALDQPSEGMPHGLCCGMAPLRLHNLALNREENDLKRSRAKKNLLESGIITASVLGFFVDLNHQPKPAGGEDELR